MGFVNKIKELSLQFQFNQQSQKRFVELVIINDLKKPLFPKIAKYVAGLNMLLALNYANAQSTYNLTLQGTVTDSVTAAPLDSVLINFNSADTNLVKYLSSTITDNGQFYINDNVTNLEPIQGITPQNYSARLENNKLLINIAKAGKFTITHYNTPGQEISKETIDVLPGTFEITHDNYNQLGNQLANQPEFFRIESGDMIATGRYLNINGHGFYSHIQTKIKNSDGSITTYTNNNYPEQQNSKRLGKFANNELTFPLNWTATHENYKTKTGQQTVTTGSIPNVINIEIAKNNYAPVLYDIPDFELTVGAKKYFNLNDYVHDPDHDDSEINWTADYDSTKVKVTIDDITKIAEIEALESGMPLIMFEGIDPLGASDTDGSTATINNPVYFNLTGRVYDGPFEQGEPNVPVQL